MNDFTLMYQKDLSAQQIEIAKKYFEWFIEESFSGRKYFSRKENKWIIGNDIPSWKHLTRGGHKNGRPLSRNILGMRCDWLSLKDIDKEESKKMVFRRHGKNKRLFVVQKIEDMIIFEDNSTTNDCPCRQCLGGRKAKSALSIDKFCFFGYYKGK